MGEHGTFRARGVASGGGHRGRPLRVVTWLLASVLHFLISPEVRELYAPTAQTNPKAMTSLLRWPIFPARKNQNLSPQAASALSHSNK